MMMLSFVLVTIISKDDKYIDVVTAKIQRMQNICATMICGLKHILHRFKEISWLNMPNIHMHLCIFHRIIKTRSPSYLYT